MDSVRTAPLTLRRPRPDDVDAVFRTHRDPRANLHNPDGPRRSMEEAGRLPAFFLESWAEPGFGYRVVEARSLPFELPLVAKARPANEPAKRVALRAARSPADLDRGGFVAFALPG